MLLQLNPALAAAVCTTVYLMAAAEAADARRPPPPPPPLLAEEKLKGGAWLWHDDATNWPSREPRDYQRGAGAHEGNGGGGGGGDEADVHLLVDRRDVLHMSSVNVSFRLGQVSGANLRDTVNRILAYCPADSGDHDYVDFAETGEQTSGMVTFGPLPNMRCDFQFRFARDNTILALSEVVSFTQGPEQPTQIRIASTSVPSEMRVMWVSSMETNSEVQFGPVSGTLTRSSPSVSHTYKASDMCDQPANIPSAIFFRDPGFIHDAVMDRLAPGKKYSYRVGSAGHWSQEYTFVVPLTPGDPSPQKYFVMADFNEYKMAPGSTRTVPADSPKDPATTVNRILAEIEGENTDKGFSAVMHVGDIAYSHGRGYVWEQFGALVEPIATRVPYMVGIGNHDYTYYHGGDKDPSGAPPGGFHVRGASWYGISEGECGVPYDQRFHMPDNGNKAFWYSVEMGNVHHTFISTEHDFNPGSPLHEWLEADLKSVDRSKTPWLIVYGHRPLYCSEQFTADYKSQEIMRAGFENLLMEYRVDVYFAGHYHSYERTCPVFQEQCLEDDKGRAQAPVHIVVGNAGQPRDRTGYMNKAWSRAALLDYGYARVTVQNNTHLLLEIVLNSDATVYDHVWIVPDNRTEKSVHSSIRVIPWLIISVIACFAIYFLNCCRFRNFHIRLPRKLDNFTERRNSDQDDVELTRLMAHRRNA